MDNVHILRDINSKGYRLGSTREMELEEALRDSFSAKAHIVPVYTDAQSKNTITSKEAVNSTPEFSVKGWLTPKTNISLDDIHI
ncbi:6575_t:CDS:2, partial [Ambispora gerdemannii]